MTLTSQVIPEYVYMELSDIVATHVKEVTEALIAQHNVQPGGNVTAEITFLATFTVPEPGESCLPVKATFQMKLPKPPKDFA